MIITIHGQTPAQKNNKQIFKNSRSGSNFITSSEIFKTWQKEALTQVDNSAFRFRAKPNHRVKIDYMFYVKDNRGRDVDNMIASVNDLLQLAGSDYGPDKKGKIKPIKGTGIIIGDNWQVLKLGESDACIDKENPRVELILSETNQWSA